ncbi:hypothetical protein [Caballeronia sp. LZ034LL]|uniref:DUF805 domain-containing protein n=1 Tax=Caballeronia sp. LZ034LL TaxID=3038567 RepID=UPI00285DAA95|nr:hypothetical protein [Caballeronia sp. LZ034LL]MDR5832858.1 hypothetical protein [Caballeronia sp. LZ034LL]
MASVDSKFDFKLDNLHTEFGLVSLLTLLAFAVITLYPYVRIVRRAGFSGWWVLFGFVPVLNLIMLWVFACSKWPAIGREQRA